MVEIWKLTVICPSSVGILLVPSKKQQTKGPVPRTGPQRVKKASQSSPPAGGELSEISFCRSMYVAENTSRPASVEFVCRRQTNYARGRAQPFRKSGRSHFFDIQKLPAVPQTAGSFSWSLTRPWGHRTGGRTYLERHFRTQGRSSSPECQPFLLQPRHRQGSRLLWDFCAAPWLLPIP